MRSLLGLIHLIIVIVVIFNIVKSDVSTGSKILWSLIVLVFPVVGIIAWYFLGPRKGS
ncbi:MAG TPA: PLDc N-terminal domain-containing protein [Rhodothermales bacterium]|nr:PLDc N-terminal domain-containing protein [Rhodothermales bacterium]